MTTKLALPASVAAGLAAYLAIGDPRLGFPDLAADLPRAFAVLAAGLWTVSSVVRVARGQRALGPGRILLLGVLVAATMLISGPGAWQHASWGLSHPASLSLTRTLLHSFLLVTLISLALDACLRTLLLHILVPATGPTSLERNDLGQAPVEQSHVSQNLGGRILSGALVFFVAIQISLGVAQRFHPILLWPHILVALTAVLPLAMRVGLLSLLGSDDGSDDGITTAPSKALAIALLTSLTLQIGLGISAYAVPTHVALGEGSATFDFLVTLVHFLGALLLLGVSIAHSCVLRSTLATRHSYEANPRNE